ncbi:glycosyltransferase, partial [bacterium]|nr:glycosyltransferase [bacterium]
DFEKSAAERDLQISHLSEALTQRDVQMAGLGQSLAERDAQIANLNQSVAEQGRQITEFLSSTSWKITWPLRIIGHQLRRFRHMDLRRRIACLLGIRYWQDEMPKISQGFAGEELLMPGANADNPLISVVMPAYNACRSGKKHFLSALESVANQSYKNIELIIVDDGSTDDTRQVCNDFLATRSDLHARYFNKKNGGQSSARNFGVNYCSGEYIAFIDQDDEWYPDKLEKIVPWLGDKSIDALYTDADTIDSEGNVTHGKIHQTLSAGWPHPKKGIEDILFRDVFVMPGLMTLKKEIFQKVGGFDENLSGYEDDDLFLRLFENGRIFYLPVPTLRWRFHGGNYSFSGRMLKSRSYYWRKLLKNYTDNGADRIRVRIISLRFFWEFIFRALDQYEVGNALYRSSINGAREILPHLPKIHRLLFGFIFLLPLKYAMPMLILPIKVLNFFKKR